MLFISGTESPKASVWSPMRWLMTMQLFKAPCDLKQAAFLGRDLPGFHPLKPLTVSTLAYGNCRTWRQTRCSASELFSILEI